jgi:hypothetical protein
MESHVSRTPSVEIDKNSYEVIFKFQTMTSLSLFMVELDQFRKKQIIPGQEKKTYEESKFSLQKSTSRDSYAAMCRPSSEVTRG